MDYEPLLKLPSGIDDIESLFMTERGSTYAHHQGSSTTRNRSAEGHQDKTTGLQPRSSKTIYVPEEHVDNLMRAFRNKNTSTQLVPLDFDKETGVGRLGVQALENTRDILQRTQDNPKGEFKKGSNIVEAPFTNKPRVGYAPVEIFGSSVSPAGEKGEGVHWGSKITEVHPKPARLMPSSGRGGGGMGGSMSSRLNPMSLQNLYAKGGSVKMPEDYSLGGWKLI